jgi:two-component system sensor histidine kinase UhpB
MTDRRAEDPSPTPTPRPQEADAPAWRWRGSEAEELRAMRALVDALPLGVALIEAAPGGEPVPLVGNAFHAELLGAQARTEAAPGGLPFRVFRPDRRTPIAPGDWPAMEAIRSGRPIRDVEHHVFWPDGTWRVVLVSAVPLRAEGEGSPSRSVVAILDVTARREAEQALERRERFLSTVFQGALDGIWVAGEGGQIVQVNEAYAEMIGYSAEELLRMSIAEVEAVETPEEIAARARRIQEMGGDRFESRHRRKDGRIIDVEVSARFLGEEGGRTVAFLRDVTERKRAEAALHHSESRYRALAARLQRVREEERGRLARDLHDEMGQVLAALASGIGRLERRIDAVPLGEKTRDLLEGAVELSDLVDQAMGTVRRIAADQRAVQLELLGLGPAIEAEVVRFSERSGIQAVAEVSPELPALGREAATALYRVVQECLTNVARHSGATRAWVSVGSGEGALELQVEDDGRGFGAQPVDMSRSLGLLGMQERMESIGGTIAFEGSPKGGAAVRARVPVPATPVP